jgi:hypothetical protein
MTRTRGVLLCLFLALSACAACAASASAQTFFVNQRNGENTPTCGFFAGGHEGEKKNPCLTINEAVEKTEGFAAPNTVMVNGEEGPYAESLELATIRDKNLTIAGEEGGAVISGHVSIKSPANAITLSNLEIHSNGAVAVSGLGAAVTLINDHVLSESTSRAVQDNSGPLTIEGGKITTESDSGFAVFDSGGALTVNGVQIFDGEGGIGSEAGGIASGAGSLSVSGTRVVNEGSASGVQFGIVAEGDSSATIRNSSVVQGSPAIGVIFENAPVTVEGLKVEMQDKAATVEAIDVESAAAASLSHVETSGEWTGPAAMLLAPQITISDSRLVSNLLAKSFAVRYSGTGATSGLLVQRSLIEAPIKAPAALQVMTGNATLDSSEALGGQAGVFFEAGSATRALTVSASTLGPFNGTLSEAPGSVGVEAKATGKAGTANVSIQGSVLLEAQTALAGLEDHAVITCTNSAVPSQIQTPNLLKGTGEVNCAAGTSGNTNSSGELATLFAEPLHNWGLAPGASAVDSVPAGAIALPFGLTPSSTDFAGNPRVVDGNGDCAAVQDKGALELQGHSAPCPVPSHPGAPPHTAAAKPAITGLSIAPGAFRAAPTGATLAKKKKYGATLSWRDSQAATSTFTVYRLVSGRRQGGACKRPSAKNRHGKKCTLKIKVGTFTHADRAGADRGHFSGRLKSRRLAAGSYQLVVVPSDANGTGAAVSRAFKIL